MHGLKLLFSFLLSLLLHGIIFYSPQSHKQENNRYKVLFKYSESSLKENSSAETEKEGPKEKSSNSSTPGVKQLAKPITDISPVYPQLSRIYKEEGIVIISVKIGLDGKILRSSVVKSTGHERLDKSALKAVESAQFSPMLKDGKQEISILNLEFSFELDN